MKTTRIILLLAWVLAQSTFLFAQVIGYGNSTTNVTLTAASGVVYTDDNRARVLTLLTFKTRAHTIPAN